MTRSPSGRVLHDKPDVRPSAPRCWLNGSAAWRWIWHRFGLWIMFQDTVEVVNNAVERRQIRLRYALQKARFCP